MATPVTRPSAATWHCAYVYYHEQDRSGLLVDAVAPLLDRVAAETEAAFIWPHWRRGPHIRLNIRAGGREWSEVIRPAIEETIGGYLREHPSTTRLDERARLAQHRALARHEQEIGPLTPWHPNNSIRYPPFPSRLHTVGGRQDVLDLVTDFYADGNRLYLDMWRHLREGRDRLDLLMLTLMFTTARAVGGLRRNAGSFRAHSEGFLGACGGREAQEAWRAAFEEKYRRNRDLVVGRMRAVAATLDGAAAQPLPFVREWAALVTRHAERAGPIIESGVLAMPPGVREDALKGELTEYIRLALGNDEYVRRGLGNPVFLRYRVVLNHTYTQLTRMGVKPRERFLLCHLAANAIEEEYGVSAIGFLRGFTAEHPNARA